MSGKIYRIIYNGNRAYVGKESRGIKIRYILPDVDLIYNYEMYISVHLNSCGMHLD